MFLHIQKKPVKMLTLAFRYVKLVFNNFIDFFDIEVNFVVYWTGFLNHSCSLHSKNHIIQLSHMKLEKFDLKISHRMSIRLIVKIRFIFSNCTPAIFQIYSLKLKNQAT